MEDNRGKFLVFAAGYTDNMNEFLTSNPGLNSRFDKKLHFEDYTSDQMLEIAKTYLKKEDIIATQEALDHLKNYFEDLYKNKDKFFGNARTVRQTVSEAIKNQNLRMAGISAEQRNTQDIHTLTLEDVIEFKYNGNNLRKTVGFQTWRQLISVRSIIKNANYFIHLRKGT
jgi:SpoVK/Ycf46/Vps4 family AAA+-type ATPase